MGNKSNLCSKKRPILEGSFQAIAFSDFLQLIGCGEKPCLVLTLDGQAPTGLVWLHGNSILKVLTPKASGIHGLFLLWKKHMTGGFRVYQLPEGKVPKCELGNTQEVLLKMALLADCDPARGVNTCRVEEAAVC